MLLGMKGIKVVSPEVKSYLSTYNEIVLGPCQPRVDVLAKYSRPMDTNKDTDNMHIDIHESKLPEVKKLQGGVLKKHSNWTSEAVARRSQEPPTGAKINWSRTGQFKSFGRKRAPEVIETLRSESFMVGVDKLVWGERWDLKKEKKKRKRAKRAWKKARQDRSPLDMNQQRAVRKWDDWYTPFYGDEDPVPSSYHSPSRSSNVTRIIPVHAALPSSEADEKLAHERRLAGHRPVRMPKASFRPKQPSLYVEPEFIPDTGDSLDVLFQEFGNTVFKEKEELPPRDDVIVFDQGKHGKTYEDNIQWRDCPQEYRANIEQIIKDEWDVFDPEGMPRPVRGFEFNIDTGPTKPIAVTGRRYGPHESYHLAHHAKVLYKKGVISRDWGPWMFLCVLAMKPGQDHLSWHEIILRLCVNYRPLNAITRPFRFPSIRCDEAVESVNGEYRIQMDLDSGYWQILLAESSREKTAFALPDSKAHWNMMAMGLTNAHPFFVCVMSILREEWNEKRDEQGLANCDSRVIVDDLILFGKEIITTLAYWRCSLEVLKHYRFTAKLRKCRFISEDTEFAGIDITNAGNTPAHSKDDAFRALERPKSWTDLRMLIGMFGFYGEWIPLFEFRISGWRFYLKVYSSKPGTIPRRVEAAQIDAVWKQEDDCALEDLKDCILSYPILQRPDPNKRFYLKTDWCKDGMAAVLLQRDDSPEAAAAEEREAAGGPCEFDLTQSGLRLHPIKFISRRTTKDEHSWHSYVGEAGASTYGSEKFRFYLAIKEFSMIGDMFSMRYFFEREDMPSHFLQRWKQTLLRYWFTIVHRPSRMVKEVDVLTRYNNWTHKWREDDAEARKKESGTVDTPPELSASMLAIPIFDENNNEYQLGFSNVPVMIAGPVDAPVSVLVAAVNISRTIWNVSAGASTVESALDFLGLDASITVRIEIDPEWSRRSAQDDFVPIEEMIQRTKVAESPEFVDWIVAAVPRDWPLEDSELLTDLICLAARRRLLQAVILFVPLSKRECEVIGHAKPSRMVRDYVQLATDVLEWESVFFRIKNTELGGSIESDHWVIVMCRDEDTIEELAMPKDPVPGPQSILECLDPTSSPIEDYIWPRDLQKLRYFPFKEGEAPLSEPRVALEFADTSREDNRTIPVFDVDFTAPRLERRELRALDSAFVICTDDDIYGNTIRGIRPHELLVLYGFDDTERNELVAINQDLLWARLEFQPPRQSVQTVLMSLYFAERQASDTRIEMDREAIEVQAEQDGILPHVSTMTSLVLNRHTTLPMPDIQTWRQETARDHDLSIVLQALEQQGDLDKSQLSNKVYFSEWRLNHLEAEDGIVYRYETQRRARIRQIRARVVPPALRRIVISALHVSPMSGHTGYYKTYWRVAARFWWPSLSTDIREAVLGCGHCRLANATSHEAQQVLRSLDSDVPFDVVAMDAYSPGDIPTKLGEIKILTYIDVMTGFAAQAYLVELNSKTVAVAAFTTFFAVHGLPRLIMIDEGSENKGVLIAMCELLAVPHHVVSKENHKAILNERYHRYLKKVGKIHTADCQSLSEWKMGAAFACYAWNASPIDGTNIIRSFAAVGREFLFPIDISDTSVVPARLRTSTGDASLQHVEASFPLLLQQRELLSVLNAERRRAHVELKNEGRKTKTFAPGDIVQVQKQVQTRDGVPAKQMMRTRGPYRVIEPTAENPNSYWVQRIPFIQGLGKKGKRTKESAARMEKLPSTLVIHKRTDGTDSRLASLDTPAVTNPLEQYLRIHQFGTYKKADDDSFAFIRIEDLWQDEVDDDDVDDFIVDESQVEEPEQERESTTVTEPMQIDPSQLVDLTDTVDGENGNVDDSEFTPIPIRKRRRRRKPARFRDLEASDETVSTATALRRLYNRIESSKDRLFFIKHLPDGQVLPTWYLVQVDLDETDPIVAKDWGIYHVRWYIRHHEDAKRRLQCNCRFWPEIHEIKSDGTFGKLYPIRPHKVNKLLETKGKLYGWYQMDVNLAETGLLGPFDFGSDWIVPKPAWNQLKLKAAELDLNVNSAFEQTPL